MADEDLATGAPTTRILASALASFAEQGYHGTTAPRHHGTTAPRHHGTTAPRHHGTTTRDLAAGAGMSVLGAYHHYRSKQDVLMALMPDVMGVLLRRSRTALEAVEDAGPT